jgi:ATP-dependent Clp protease ATP-binding subunit ClpX
MERVHLHFSEGAMVAIAREALKRRSGARGLRAILEQAMLDIMYDIPSLKNVRECLVNEEVILKYEKPILVFEPQAESA